jgi:hypothetical protein
LHPAGEEFKQDTRFSKSNIKFIRRGTVGRKERERHFLFPTQEMEAKTPRSVDSE